MNGDLKYICQKPSPDTYKAIGNQTGKWIISPKDVYYDKSKPPLGIGEFGEVYKGEQRFIQSFLTSPESRSSGVFRGTLEVAVKTLKCDKDVSDNSRAQEEFHKETKVLMQINHPNLVQVHIWKLT